MKKIINTSKAPSPIGPYNQAILAGNTLYASGQIAFDPASQKMIVDTIESETTQVMENLRAVLLKADMTFENVVKTSIFLTDMNDYSKINAIYGRYFNSETAPARETIEVSNLPNFVHVEISIVAIK